jgi:hypothetical protein
MLWGIEIVAISSEMDIGITELILLDYISSTRHDTPYIDDLS